MAKRRTPRKKKNPVAPVDGLASSGMMLVVELDALASSPEEKEYCLIDFAKHLRVHPSQITHWDNGGLPSVGTGREKRYTVIELARWLAIKNKTSGRNQWTSGSSEGDDSLRDQKLTAEIEKIKIANEERLGRLVPVDQLVSDWKLAAATLQERMLAVVRPYGDEAVRSMEQGLTECARLIGQGGEA